MLKSLCRIGIRQNTLGPLRGQLVKQTGTNKAPHCDIFTMSFNCCDLYRRTQL